MEHCRPVDLDIPVSIGWTISFTLTPHFHRCMCVCVCVSHRYTTLALAFVCVYIKKYSFQMMLTLHHFIVCVWVISNAMESGQFFRYFIKRKLFLMLQLLKYADTLVSMFTKWTMTKVIAFIVYKVIANTFGTTDIIHRGIIDPFIEVIALHRIAWDFTISLSNSICIKIMFQLPFVIMINQLHVCSVSF